MDFDKEKIGAKNFIAHAPVGSDWVSAEAVLDSWTSNTFCLNRDSFSDFQDGDLKDYVKFKCILIDFRAFYGLDKYNLKQIDQYVWQLGKEHFPKNYGKKKQGDKTL